MAACAMAPVPLEPVDPLLLHRLVFLDDPTRLSAALAEDCGRLSERCRGHTPLSLAAALGRHDCIRILLDAGADTLALSPSGWSPYHEATSYGDRSIMEAIFRRRRDQLSFWFNSRGKRLLEQLSHDLKDIMFEMSWSFNSFIPFVSRLCPSDTYKFYKKGSSVRIDTTLVGFERLTWLRGDISIILNGNGDDSRLVICDHQRKLVQQVWPRDFSLSDEAVQEEISVSLNTSLNARPEIDWSSFTITRAKKGFFAFKYDRKEQIGPWETTVWHMDGFEIISRVRTEHLDATPLPAFKIKENKIAEKAKKKADAEKRKKETAQYSTRSSGGFVIANPDVTSGSSSDSDAEAPVDPYMADNDADDEETRIKNYRHGYRNIQDPVADEDYRDWRAAKRAFRELAEFRPSLDPPASVPFLSYEDFFDPRNSDKEAHIGRPVKMETKRRAYRATMWMYEGRDASLTKQSADPTAGPIPIQSDEFPIKIKDLIPLLDLIGMGTNEHIRSLTEFFNVQLPSGFPVQVEIPIGMLPLNAVVRFDNIRMYCDDPRGAALFDIPGSKDGYREGEVVRGSSEGSEIFLT